MWPFCHSRCSPAANNSQQPARNLLHRNHSRSLPKASTPLSPRPPPHGGVNFSSPAIVSDDRWVLQGCPVSGPSLSIDRSSGNLKVLLYAAGEGASPGLYFAESKDGGRSFSPRELVSPETVRGTPWLAMGGNNAIALWQTSDTTQTRMREIGKAGAVVSVAANAELPAGVLAKDRLFVAYIAKEKERRSIWLIRAD